MIGTEKYLKGDYLICIEAGATPKWLRINNSGEVFGFQGAGDAVPNTGSYFPKAGDYTWEMIDKSASKLSDLTNVDLSMGTGTVLKYAKKYDQNGVLEWEGWTLGDDETGAGNNQISGNSIQSASIKSASIKTIDANYSGIQQTKFNGLTDLLGQNLNKTGGTLTGDLNLNQQSVTGITHINNIELAPLFTTAEAISSTVALKEPIMQANTTNGNQFYDESKALQALTLDNFPEGTTNKYFTNSRVFSTKLNIAAPVVSPTSPADTSDVIAGNTIANAIQKLENRIKYGVVPPATFDGSDIEDKAITLGHLSVTDQSPSAGDTFKVLRDSNTGELYWGLSSVVGINYINELDITGFDDLLSKVSAQTYTPEIGDYYILTETGVDTNGKSWSVGDWAIWNDYQDRFEKIPNTGSFQKFNDRENAIFPKKGDFSFDMLNFTGSTIGHIEDVDMSTTPTAGQVLKYKVTNGVGKWAPGVDNGGVSGKITASNVSDDITSEAFADEVFLESHFKSELRSKVNEHYRAGQSLLTHLDFSNKDIQNCGTINTVNIFDLYESCTGFDTSQYLALLPTIDMPVLTPPDPSNPTQLPENYFLNETGNSLE